MQKKPKMHKGHQRKLYYAYYEWKYLVEFIYLYHFMHVISFLQAESSSRAIVLFCKRAVVHCPTFDAAV